MIKIREFLKRRRTLVIIAVLIIAGFFAYSFLGHKGQNTVYATASVTRSDLVSTVTGTGQVSVATDINIAPQATGQVTSVSVTQGEYVSGGQTLFTINQSSALNQLQQEESAMQSAQVSLDNAKANLVTAEKQQDQLVANAYRTLLNSGIEAITGPYNHSTATPAITGTYTGNATGTYNIALHTVSGSEPDNFSVSGLENISNISISPNGISVPLGTMGLYIQFPSDIKANDTWSVPIPNTNSSSYVSDYNSYEAALETREQTIQSSEQSISSTEVSLVQAQSALQGAQLSLQNTLVKAPFAAQVAAVNVNIGDTASQSTTVTLVSGGKIAEVSLNEIDAAKVKVGQQTTLTFAALPNVVLNGTVVELDELGTVSQGVVTYGAKIKINGDSSQVKSGMSVTAEVVTDTVKNALVVPSGAVKSMGDKNFVQVLNSAGKPVLRGVQTGVSNDVMTQILSGLSLGDKVVTATLNQGSQALTPSLGTNRPNAGLGTGRGNAFFVNGG